LFKFKTAILLIILLLTGNGILQAAPTLASVIKAEETDGKPPVLVDGGLLGALGAGMDEVQGRLGLSMHLLDGWRLRTARAGEEAEVLAEQAYEHPSWNAAADFLIVSVTWFAAFIGLMLLARLVLNYVCSRRVTQNKVRVKSLLGYALPYLFPAMIALPLTLSVSRFLQDSMGVSLALSLAYASSGGVF